MYWVIEEYSGYIDVLEQHAPTFEVVGPFLSLKRAQSYADSPHLESESAVVVRMVPVEDE